MTASGLQLSHAMICSRCGSTAREIQWSRAAEASVCLGCHLRAAPRTAGTDRELLDELAAELRRDADRLAAVAESHGPLRAIAVRLGQIPLLLEVGSSRESPAELVIAAGRLRAEAGRLLKAVAG